MSFSFWRKWLIGACIYHVAFALLLSFGSQTQLMDVLLNQYYDPIFWPDGQIPAAAMQYKNWLTSVLGAVVASWVILIAFIAYYPFKLKEKWSWNAIAVSVAFWFVIDTGCSLYYDVAINAALNSSTLLLLGLPLLFTRRYFYGKAEDIG